MCPGKLPFMSYSPVTDIAKRQCQWTHNVAGTVTRPHTSHPGRTRRRHTYTWHLRMCQPVRAQASYVHTW